ncbi:hypothetical protein [Sporosarcina psychrophila]|uniref:hypothetical protein n=1 Tax=Sporosarcina psychrophila TaxID=1476 RepID=UPI000B22EA88|nr:hypothetical protein [Sporosarcina psychrophila]
MINHLNQDYYFDDKPAVLETLRNHPLKLFVKIQSYNRHLDFPRITDWSELFGLLIGEKK